MKTKTALKRLAAAWNDFWFAPEDPLSLGVLRVLVGGMLAYTHFVWGLNLDGFFGPDGWQSAEAVRGFFQNDWLPSLWWYVPAEHLRLVHVLCFVPLVLFLFGVLTPVTSVLALVITISNSNRAPLANYGLDQILSLLTLYLVIGGSGSSCSFDAWSRRRRLRRDSAATSNAETPFERRRTSRARLGTRLIQVHFCVIYFFAGTAKLQGEAWWNGEAIWRAFANQEYQAIDMTWLAHYPWVLQLATHVTNFWEISFAFLVWNRTLRPFVLAIGVAMHAGIGLCMGMITFGSIMIFGYIAFVPPEVLQKSAGLLRTVVTRQAASPHATRSLHPIFVDRPAPEEHATPSPTLEAPPAPHYNGHSPAADDRARSPTRGDGSERPQDDKATRRDAKPSVAVCDPNWKYREFTHYLTRRNFRTFVGTSPVRIWRFVEEHELAGVVFFADKLSPREFELLLQDLSLSPINELPVVIALRQKSRIERALAMQSAKVRVVQLPQTYRVIREALECVLQSSPEADDAGQAIEPTDDADRPREDLREGDPTLTPVSFPGEAR